MGAGDEVLSGRSGRRWLLVLLLVLALVQGGCSGGSGGTVVPPAGGGNVGPTALSWSTRQSGTVLEVGYGSGVDFPQYAAFHLDSSYLRLIFGPSAGWGTSVVLLPSLWTGGVYIQGGAVVLGTPSNENGNLVIPFSGNVSSLAVAGNLRLEPPSGGVIRATVTIISVTGDVVLDNRPGEAFKPLLLSSMHISDTQWDASEAYLGAQPHAIPAAGWIVQPPVNGQTFGLRGGTSSWKANAPTVDIGFDRSLAVTGWVTPSGNPNDDNVGFWNASDQVLRSWQYTVTSSAP